MERWIDLAEVNGRVYVNNVSLGTYGERFGDRRIATRRRRAVVFGLLAEWGGGRSRQSGVVVGGVGFVQMALQSRSRTGSDCLKLLPALLSVPVLCLLTRERTETGTPGVDQPTPREFLESSWVIPLASRFRFNEVAA